MRFPNLRITTDFIGVYTDEGKAIASLDSEAAPDCSTEESLAFAALFAASPRMLHAMEDADQAIQVWRITGKPDLKKFIEIQDDMRAAMARARRLK